LVSGGHFGGIVEKNNLRSGLEILTARRQKVISSAHSKVTSFSRARTSVKFIVLLLAVLLPGSVLLYEASLKAASNIIIVNTASDTSTSGDGSCSLREAINNANSVGIDTTGGDCNVGTGIDIVNFGNFTDQDGNDSITLLNSLPVIAHNLTIDGGSQTYATGTAGRNVFVSTPGGTYGPFFDEVVRVNSGATLYVANLVIGSGNGALDIYNNGGMVTLSNAYVASDHQTAGGAIYNGGTMAITTSNVGGIYNTGTLVATNSNLSDTFSGGNSPNGGALYNAGTSTVTNCSLSGDDSGAGGAIYNDGTLTVKNSTFSSDGAPMGSAIYNNSGSATFSNSILVNPQGGVECGETQSSTEATTSPMMVRAGLAQAQVPVDKPSETTLIRCSIYTLRITAG
jgi:CSLREA domain-containing protein